MVSYYPLIYFFSILLSSTFFSTNNAQLENSTQPELWIPQGTLLGKILTTRNDRNIFAFHGIPYAQPPIGNLRFAKPIAAEGWNGTRNASTDASICPQILSSASIGEEDCLYINVYTPELPQNTNSSLLPVMVYIHGGGFVYGSLDSTLWGPEFLLDKNMLLVAPNYRLGLFGFLSTGDEVASGNWGLKDQILALEWIQKNIRYFGGDPDQVTLLGQSAGAVSVHLLTLSNATIGLFHRYITHSGSALADWAHRPRDAYSSYAFQFGDYVGCSNDSSESLISCLRTGDASDMIVMQSQFLVSESLSDITWGPTDEPDIEGAVLTDSPANLFAAGAIRDLPWISGVVRDEGTMQTAALYADKAKLDNFMENMDSLLPTMMFWTYQSDSGAAWTNAAKSYYFPDGSASNTSAILSNLTMLGSDSQFFYPAHNALQQHYDLAESPQYFYTFNYRGSYSNSDILDGNMDYGVMHSDDLFYLFPYYESIIQATVNTTRSEIDYEMVDAMIELWTSFVINGTPTTSALNVSTSWQPWSTEDNYLRIGNGSDATLEVQYSFFADRMQFWNDLYSSTNAEAIGSNDSNTVTPLSHLFFLLLVACIKLFQFAVTTGRF